MRNGIIAYEFSQVHGVYFLSSRRQTEPHSGAVCQLCATFGKFHFIPKMRGKTKLENRSAKKKVKFKAEKQGLSEKARKWVCSFRDGFPLTGSYYSLADF